MKNFFRFRQDRGELGPPRRTDEGFLIVDGFIAKPGILVYQGPQGPIRELVLPENLHRDGDLQTLMRKPVTLKHPRKDVNPKTVRKDRVGSVGESFEIDDQGKVKVSFTVERSDAIKAVESGTQQLSPGYRVEISPTPGVHPTFGRYDAIQVGRRYNHLAIVDRARGGSLIRLRADEAYPIELPEPLPEGPMKRILAMLLAAGLERADAETTAAKIELEVDTRIDSATEEVKGELVTMTGERDALKTAAEGRGDGDGDGDGDDDDLPARLDWFDERASLVALAGKHDIEGDALKVDNDKLGLAIVRKIDSDCAEDATPDYVKAYLKVHASSRKDERPGGSLYRKDEGHLGPDTNAPDPRKNAQQAYLDNISAAREKKLALPVATRSV